MSDLDRLEMLLRAMPFDLRMELEERWEQAGTPTDARIAEAEAVATEQGDGCDL